MDVLRGNVIVAPGQTRLVTETCVNCGVVFAMAEQFYDSRQARTGPVEGRRFYCPNGHVMWYEGKSAETKLKEAQARETALNDQLRAAIREGDAARQEALRIRQRIANGVCPCCTRTFRDVARHMMTQHPEFAIPGDIKHATGEFACSCGQKFETFRGLRSHQGQVRPENWDAPNMSRWFAHLSVL